jgi:hypothetical protein
VTTNRRIWVALTSDPIEGLSQVASGSSTITFVGVGFDTGERPSGTAAAGTARPTPCIDVPSTTVVPSTEYTLVVDWTVSGTLTCSVQAGTGTGSREQEHQPEHGNHGPRHRGRDDRALERPVNNFTAKVVLEQN